MDVAASKVSRVSRSDFYNVGFSTSNAWGNWIGVSVNKQRLHT